MNEKDWIPVTERLPSQAGYEVFVSAVNKYGQRTEFIAFLGYSGSDRWYTFDCTKMRKQEDRDNAVSDVWTITHWKDIDRLPRPVNLVLESTRPKSEKYRCTSCGEFCYYPHCRIPIPYRFCPNCGKEVVKNACD